MTTSHAADRTPLANKLPLRAIIYSRVSTEKQKDNTSHENQYEAGLRWAGQHGAVVVAYYRETESGATYLARAELQKALEDLEANRADVIVFYDASRFSRDVLNAELIRARIEKAKKRMAFCDMELRYDADGELSSESDLHLSFRNVLSKSERREMRKRSMDGQRKILEAGRMPGGCAPFGYHMLTRTDVILGRCTKEQTGTYVIIEEQAALVRQIFAWYEQGYSLDKICRTLNGQGTRTQKGKLWKAIGISDILKNEIYKGWATRNKTRRVHDESRLAAGFRTKSVQVPRAAQDVVRIQAPALVEEVLWERVNQRLLVARARHGGRHDRLYALSGLLRCPHCGGVMRGKKYLYRGTGQQGTGQTALFYYRCTMARGMGSGRIAPRDTYCEQPLLRAEFVERVVFRELFRLLEQEALLAAALKKQVEKTHRAPEAALVERARAQCAALERQESAIRDAQIQAVAAGLDSAPYLQKLLELAAQRGQAAVYLREQEEHQARLSAVPRQARQLSEMLEPARRVLESDTISAAEKHDFLALVLERVEWAGVPEGIKPPLLSEAEALQEAKAEERRQKRRKNLRRTHGRIREKVVEKYGRPVLVFVQD